MTKARALTILFLLLAVVQTSFFSSLPGLLAYAPLVLACGVYLRQHVQERSGVLWIAGFGMFLDLLAIPSFPFESVSYAAAAVIATLTAGHVFSNRSWYGLLACGASSMAALGLTRAVVLGIVSLRHPERVSWAAFGETFFWNMVLLPILLSLCFAFAGQIRSFLRTTFMISRDRDTL
jgi:rod shape-determining protein MreD